MESETVVPIRPKDPTASLRQRRAREKRRNEKPSEINPDVTVPEPSRKPSRSVPASHPDVALPGVPWSVNPLAGTTVGLMAVSLTHLSDGVTQLTAIPEWQSWAMAMGIDCMLISVALAQLTAPPDVKRDIAVVAHSQHVGGHPSHVGGAQCARVHRRALRRRPLGPDRVRVLRPGGHQRGDVHPGPAHEEGLTMKFVEDCNDFGAPEMCVTRVSSVERISRSQVRVSYFSRRKMLEPRRETETWTC